MSDATSGNAREPRAKHRTAAAAAVAAAPAELCTDLVTTADFTAFQQILRQDVTDVIQQWIVEVDETVSGRMDMLSSINTTLQNMSAKPIASRPHRITDFLSRNWDGSNDKGRVRNFMSDLHFWMQAWSDEGETMLVSVESTDKFEVLHTTTANEPLKIVPQIEGQKGFEAWHEPLRIVQQTRGQNGLEASHAIVRRDDQRNMSDKNQRMQR